MNSTVKLLLVLLLAPISVNANHRYGARDDWKKWLGHLQFFFAAFFVIWGLHFLLYSDMALYRLMKKYSEMGILVPGSVLTSESSESGIKYEVSVLYSTENGDQSGKRFIRKFEMDRSYSWGERVDILYLEEFPRSGCAKMLVNQQLTRFSIIRAGFLLFLGAGILCTMMWFAWQDMQLMGIVDQLLGWLFLAGATFIVVRLAQCWFNSLFEERRRSALFAASPVLVTKANGQDKSDPLLQPTYPQIVQCKDVGHNA